MQSNQCAFDEQFVTDCSIFGKYLCISCRSDSYNFYKVSAEAKVSEK